MKKLLNTNPNSWPALISRLALGFTIFPHGAQKLLGIFGGYGFNGTMGFLTGPMHLPYIIGVTRDPYRIFWIPLSHSWFPYKTFGDWFYRTLRRSSLRGSRRQRIFYELGKSTQQRRRMGIFYPAVRTCNYQSHFRWR